MYSKYSDFELNIKVMYNYMKGQQMDYDKFVSKSESSYDENKHMEYSDL
jgi:hypothetical protein